MEIYDPLTNLQARENTYPILICLLGYFRALKAGQPVALPCGGKAEGLLRSLALAYPHPVPRDVLTETLWPHSDPSLANQSLDSLTYTMRKLFRSALSGAAPVINVEGYYALNTQAGVGLDVMLFDALAQAADQQRRAGQAAAAVMFYQRAVALYGGEFVAGSDIRAIVERERLRSRYLALLAYLADHAYDTRDYSACLDYAQRVLITDACREDAHRVVMRSYVRLGQRAQAVRQYRLCQDILRVELEAEPELATRILFDQIRHAPDSI